jgi:cytoskeletal protein RodZ
MTIEGLGKKFQEARLARGLTLDEAARMTKIRPSRLAEIEADDFSQFPSLAYAKGFLQIYGKFLDVDVTPYLEAFETSEHVTIDGYSYLQDNPAPAPVRAPVVKRRPSRASAPSPMSSGERPSLMPLVVGIAVIIAGFWIGKLLVNLRRLAPPSSHATNMTQPSAAPSASALPYSTIPPTSGQFSAEPKVASNPTAPPPTTPPAAASIAPPKPVTTPAVTPALAAAPASPPPALPSAAPREPEVRRAEPVRPEDLAKAEKAAETASGSNRIVIRPLKKTYVKVVVDNEANTPAFERWVSPSDGALEFRGEHVAIRVLDRDAIQIKKNGKAVEDDDSDITIE